MSTKDNVQLQHKFTNVSHNNRKAFVSSLMHPISVSVWYRLLYRKRSTRPNLHKIILENVDDESSYCVNDQKQSSIGSLLAFKNKTCGKQLSRNAYHILKILTAAHYSRIYLHFDDPSITSYNIMTSLQSVIIVIFFLLQSNDPYRKPTGNTFFNKLLSWMRLSSIKFRRNYWK